MSETICRCGLDKGRMLHMETCPLYPGQPLRMTAAQFREHIGLAEAEEVLREEAGGRQAGDDERSGR